MVGIHGKYAQLHMIRSLSYGSFLGALDIRGCRIIGIPKGDQNHESLPLPSTLNL